MLHCDCHVHAVLDGVNYRESIGLHSSDAGPCEAALRKMLESYRDAGVTYLRDGGDRWGACLAAKSLAAQYGIEYSAPLAPLCLKGNYGSFIGREYCDFESYKALVDEMAASGADFIKLMLSGIVSFREFGVVSGFEVPYGLMRDMVSYAHGLGFAVMAHVNGARHVEHAVLAGVDSVEHGFFMDDAAVDCLVEHGVVWVPTLAPVECVMGCGRFDDDVLRRTVETHRRLLAQVRGLGGLIALGDDAGAFGVPHGKGIASEYECMRSVFGDATDEVLSRGNAQIMRVFAPRA